jgi:hypothetical protein
MLKKRGVKDVNQLQGGIHRYLEEFGDQGLFKGINFVFDKRVQQNSSHQVVGKCIECQAPFDEISGSRICTVCRDLVLVCPECQLTLREYHCHRHASWKTFYFTFLQLFDTQELEEQREKLEQLRETYIPPAQHRNVRKTLSRQMTKVDERIKQLQAGTATVDRDALRQCRSCSLTTCNGLCWGFWKNTCSSSNQDQG